MNDDLAALGALLRDGIMLPKGESTADVGAAVTAVTAVAPSAGLIVLVETAKALVVVSDIARVPGVRRLMLGAFALSGALAALTGALTSIKSASAGPATFETLLLPAVTAALIGGVSLFGGRGSVFGIAIGALTLRFINSGLSLEGAAFYVQTFFTGAVLIVVVVLELLIGRPELRARWRRRRIRRRGLSEASA